MRYCWFEPVDGHTCMLPEGHDGPHGSTSDDDIIFRLVDWEVCMEHKSGVNWHTAHDPPEGPCC